MRDLVGNMPELLCGDCGKSPAVGMLVDLAGDDDVEVCLCQTCADHQLSSIDPEYKKDVIFELGIFTNEEIVNNMSRLRKEHDWHADI